MKYTKVKRGDITKYYYDLSELKEWLKRGREDGDVGMIITKFDGKFMTYRGFGTIEHPVKDLCTITQVYLPEFDDIKPEPSSHSYKFQILDLSK